MNMNNFLEDQSSLVYFNERNLEQNCSNDKDSLWKLLPSPGCLEV